MSLAGATYVHLDLPDEQYRRNGSRPPVAEALAQHIADADQVFAPLGFFFSGDHGLVRDAALELRTDAVLYADLPHAGFFGLPSWVSGEPTELDVDAAWRQRMSEAGLDPSALVGHGPSARGRRVRAEARGRSLLCARRHAALEREAPFDQLRWEVTWTR